MANKPTQPVFPLGLAAEEQSTLAGVLNTGTIEHGPDAVLTLPEGNASAGLPSSVRYNADSDEFEGFYENGGWLPLGGGGIRWEVLPHASTVTLTEGRGYLINNTTGASTVVLPSPTRIGDSVTICDAYGKFATYPLTVSPSGNNLYGSTEDMAITTDNVSATFTWSGPEQGWIITSGVGLGQGRVYSREIFTKILASETSSVALNTPPTIVDVYADGKRLAESKYSLDGNVITFSPSLPTSTELQVIEYTPIQLGTGGGSGSSTITWVYNGGSAIGGETEIMLDVVVDDVPAIDINGSRQYKNLGFTLDPLPSKITLAQELEPEDEVVVIINGTPNIYNQIDHTLREVARAANVKDSEVILSTDTTQVLNGKRVIYDVVSQRIYGLPTLPSNVYINVVSDGQLTYSPGNITVTLLDSYGAGLVGGLLKPITWSGFAGGADNTGVAAADAAFAAANSSGTGVFVPAGTYKISGNTDMSACELMFEKGATIDVQAGATLTVGRILCGLHQVFSGAGSVVFTTNTIKAHPEWFGAARGIDSTPALTKCQAACSPNKITVDLVDEYFISDLVWDRRVPAEASPRAAFKPFGSAANGVKLTAGNSVGKNSFPAISGFPGYGMRIVGTSLANICISEIQGCGDALVLETSESATTLLDTEVTLTSISACDNAVVFVADKLANVMQGNKVYVNFIANCTNSVLFRDNGLANPGPNWDSNQVITQAIDPTPSRTNAVMLKNECGYAINRFVFRVETWAGGLASTGKFISGRFNDLDAYINLSQNPVAGMFSYTGASNRVDFSSARGRNTTPVTAVNASNSMPSFNGGVPLFHNVVKLKYIPSVDWANNTQKQAYIYHQLTDQNTNAFTVQPPDSGSLRGTTVDSVIDNSLTVPYEIQINLRNVSGVTITAGTEIEFKLRVGLY